MFFGFWGFLFCSALRGWFAHSLTNAMVSHHELARLQNNMHAYIHSTGHRARGGSIRVINFYWWGGGGQHCTIWIIYVIHCIFIYIYIYKSRIYHTYSVLASRCPSLPVETVWLRKAYVDSGKKDDSRGCFQVPWKLVPWRFKMF